MCIICTTDPKDLKGRTKIDCESCQLVKYIPYIEGVLEICCEDCISLEYISPDFKELKILSVCNCKSLVNIPQIDSLEELYCHDNILLKTIPYITNLRVLSFSSTSMEPGLDLSRFKNLRSLDCSSYKYIKEIPYFEFLTVLRCWDCDNLEHISYMETLEELECSGSKLISHIHDYPNLRLLDIYQCLLITSIPDMKSLVELICEREQDDFFSCIPQYIINKLYTDCLTELDVSQYKRLIHIPRIENLKKLKCHSCPSLTSIDITDTVEYLDCQNCKELENINLSFFCSLIELYCSGTKIKSIQSMKYLQILYCVGCTYLKRIGIYENICEINCSNCPILTKIGSVFSFSKFKKIDELYCSCCPMLTFIPLFGKIEVIAAYDSPWVDYLNVIERSSKDIDRKSVV